MKTIWAVSERGAVGMQNQALGLAEALASGGGFEMPRAIEAAFRWPYTWAPMHPAFASLNALTADTRKAFAEPWPDMLITCGRKSALLALAIKRASGGRTVLIHVQDPKADPRHWDLLIVPEHDRLRGPNVLVSKGALHRVTRQKLAAGADAIRARVAHLPRPLLAVLVGGNNRYYTLDTDWMRDFIGNLRIAIGNAGGGILATVSRRTGETEANLLRGALATLPSELWDGEGPNPYFGYLGLADAILVTCDSVSMVSEACATGKPVYVARLPGASDRFDAFFDNLLKRRLIRWFDNRLDLWSNGRLDDMDGIADAARAKLGWPDANADKVLY